MPFDNPVSAVFTALFEEDVAHPLYTLEAKATAVQPASVGEVP